MLPCLSGNICYTEYCNGVERIAATATSLMTAAALMPEELLYALMGLGGMMHRKTIGSSVRFSNW